MFEFSGLNELWLGESLGLWLWYPLHTKPREHSMVTEHANTDSWLRSPSPWPWWCQAAVHWPACVAAKNAEEETWHRGPGPGLAETRASSDPDTGPDQSLLTLHNTQAQCTVEGSENSLTPDTPLVGGGGGCGNIVTVSETLRRIQKRRPGENVRHNSIHQPLASCLRVRMQVVMRPWGGWCITRALWAASPNIPVSVSTRERPRVNGPTLNWQLSNPFLSARVSGTLFFSSSPHTTTFIKRLGELKKTERSWMRPAIITQNTQQERRLMMKRMEDDKQNVSVSPFPGMTSVIWSPGAFLRSIVIPAKIMPLLFSSCRRIPQ